MIGDVDYSNWPIPPNGEPFPKPAWFVAPKAITYGEPVTVASVASTIMTNQPQLHPGHVIEIAEDLIRRLREGGHL